MKSRTRCWYDRASAICVMVATPVGSAAPRVPLAGATALSVGTYASQPLTERGTGMATNVSEREAREVAEAARESEWKLPSFGKELFMGNFRLDLIHPQPP